MADSAEQLELLLTEVAKKLKNEPQANSKQLVAYLKAILEDNSQLANAASRMIQINQDDAKGFQTFVENGTALIGFHYHVDEGILKTVLNSFIQEQKPTPVGIPQNLPRITITKFVGRQEQLETLHQQLQTKNQVIICAIAGMGGVGKTELALQYAHYHWHQDTYLGGICWLQGRDVEVGTQIVAFARTQLGLQPPDVPDLHTQVSYCWRHWQEGDVLLVLDDVNHYPEVEPYLPPQSSRFKVLITTRLQLELPQSLTLDVLEEEAAVDLLQQWIGKEKILQELANAKKLCQRLGYLPLALQLVGRYVKKQKLSLEKMLERLEEKGLGHKSLDKDNNDRTSTLNIKRGVAAAFELSWEELTNEAKQLGYLLSLFALAPIPWTLVESVDTGQDTEDLEDARVKLEDLHLLQGDETYHLHQLIREFFHEKLKQSNQVDEFQYLFCQAMVAVAKQVSELLTQQDIEEIAPAMPHMAEIVKKKRILLNNTILSDEDFCLPFVTLGRFYTSQGLYEEAKLCYQDYLSNAKERFGEYSLEVAFSQNNLASIYKKLGRYNDAENYYNKALNVTIKLLGDNHLDLSAIMNNLALLYSQPNPINEEEIYSNLSYYRQTEQRYLEARKLFRQALKIRKFHLGENHPIVAQSLNNLGMLYAELGNIPYYSWRYSSYTEKAERLLQKAFDIRRQTLKEEHPDIAESQNNLAYLYKIMHRYSEAESLFFKALGLNKRLLGEKHIIVAQGLWNLAELYKDQHEKSKAISLLKPALEIFKSCLGNEHPLVISACKRLNNWGYKIE